jgi:hypothetical protein
VPDISRLVIEIDSKGVMQASGNLEIFSKLGHKAGKETDDLANKFGAFQLIVDKLPGPMKSIASGLMGMVTPATAVVSALLELGDAATQFISNSLNTFGNFEMVRTNLEIVMGSAEKATKTFDELQRMSSGSTFGVEQLSQVATMLTQAGIKAKDLIPTLKTLGDVSMGSAEKFNSIAYNFAQVAGTGKATSMDIRQFQLAGLPIAKLLEDIGKEGDTSFGAISEAINKATGEGGMFYDAMGRGAETLIGKTNVLEAAWKSFQATVAEETYLGQFAKNVKQMAANVLNTLTQTIKGEINFFGKLNADDFSSQEEYGLASADKRLGEIKNKLSYFQTLPESLSAISDIFINSLEKEKTELEAQRTELQAIVELQKERADSESKWLSLLEQEDSKRLTLEQKIKEAYSKTEEGQKKSTQEHIAEWEKLKKSMFWEQDGFDYINGQSIPVYEQQGLSDELKQMIDVINKDLSNGLKKGREELLSWQKIFKQAMNLSETDTKQIWFNKQSTSIAQFTSMLKTANDRAKVLNETLGTETTGTLEQAASAWEQMATGMIMSGEWQSDTELFLAVVENAKEAKETLGNANLDQLIADTESELALLRLTTGEMEKQKLTAEYNVTNEGKITQALEAQNRLRNEQNRLSALSGATGLAEKDIQGLSAIEVYEKIVDSFNKSLQFLPGFAELGLVDFIDSINQSKKSFEDMYMSVATKLTDLQDKKIELLNEAGSANTEGMAIDEWANSMNAILDAVEAVNEETEYYKTLLGAILQGLKSIQKQVSNETFTQDSDELRHTIDLIKKYGVEYENVLKLENYQKKYGEENGQLMYDLEQEKEQALALANALNQLKEAGMQLAAGSLVSFANDLGQAFRDGAISGDELSNAVANMLKSMIDAMPQLLLNVGLQLMAAKQWALGLAFIGASGLMSFVSGLTDSAEQDNRNDEAERLKRIQEQITDLIESQRKQQEYYLTQKRKVDSTALSVNDAIITPRGTVYTHPEDYIIATKTPETLMGGGGANVVVNIVNNSGAKISQQESVGEDGAREIQVTIDKIVQNGIANGRYNNAFNAMNAKNQGRKVTN